MKGHLDGFEIHPRTTLIIVWNTERVLVGVFKLLLASENFHWNLPDNDNNNINSEWVAGQGIFMFLELQSLDLRWQGVGPLTVIFPASMASWRGPMCIGISGSPDFWSPGVGNYMLISREEDIGVYWMDRWCDPVAGWGIDRATNI